MARTRCLLEPLRLGGITLANRIGESAMCPCCAENGAANDWHLQPLGSSSLSGALMPTGETGEAIINLSTLEILGSRDAVLEVRIHLPPAESQVRTCLSREFAFLRREVAVSRGCAGWGERRGRQRRARSSNIALRSGSVSVGRYSSTALSPMRFATVGAALQAGLGRSGFSNIDKSLERGSAQAKPSRVH